MEVLVATKDVPFGVVITEPEQYFRISKFLKGHEPADAFRAVSDVRGKTTSRPVWKDQPVRTIDFTADSFALTSEMQLITVKCNIQGRPWSPIPGTRVGVVVTGPSDSRGKSYSRLVAEHLTLVSGKSTSYASCEHLLTFLATTEQAAQLRASEKEGCLSLFIERVMAERNLPRSQRMSSMRTPCRKTQKTDAHKDIADPGRVICWPLSGTLVTPRAVSLLLFLCLYSLQSFGSPVTNIQIRVLECLDKSWLSQLRVRID